MGNHRHSTLIEVVGRKRAGADITKAIKEADGARGTGVRWATLTSWVVSGLVVKDVSAGIRSPVYRLTQAGFEAAAAGREAQRAAAARKAPRSGKRTPRRPAQAVKRAPAKRPVSQLAQASA
jgi:hypothetical protein